MVFRLQLTTFLTKSRNFPRIFSPIAPFAADSARNRYTMGPSIREIRELSTESNTAVPAYSAVEDAAPPCAAMAAVMTGSSSFPYSLISVTVCDPRRIREFALSSSPAASSMRCCFMCAAIVVPYTFLNTVFSVVVFIRNSLDSVSIVMRSLMCSIR